MIPAAAAETLAPYRTAYRECLIPSVVLPGALSGPAAAALREQLAEAGVQPYWVADRGRYEMNDTLEAPELFESLRELAEHLAGAHFTVESARWLRLRRGSYALLRDDAPLAERHLELTLDLSAGSSGEAEVIYTHRGQIFFAAPQQPGALALVERGPTVRRYDRYLTHCVGDAEIVRLRMALRFREIRSPA
jgi:hypothetical protein